MTGKDSPKTIKKASFRKAEKIVDGYKISTEPYESFGYIGSAAEFPTGFGRGKTHEECLRETKEALTRAVALMLDLGGTPPKSMATQGRTAQINFRVTQTEKDLMKRAAAYFGSKGLGDFIRTAAITTAQSVFKNITSIIL